MEKERDFGRCYFSVNLYLFMKYTKYMFMVPNRNLVSFIASHEQMFVSHLFGI